MIEGESTLIKEKEVEIAGEVESLFCPDDKGLLIFDRTKGLHRCFRCKKYWRYKGGENITVNEAKETEERKIQEESAR